MPSILASKSSPQVSDLSKTSGLEGQGLFISSWLNGGIGSEGLSETRVFYHDHGHNPIMTNHVAGNQTRFLRTTRAHLYHYTIGDL